MLFVAVKTALRLYGFPIPEKVSQGHIPGSVNIHVDLVYEEDEQTFRDPQELRQCEYLKNKLIHQEF